MALGARRYAMIRALMNKLIVLLSIMALANTATAAQDPHSYADPDRFLVRHVALDLNADFAAHRLEGTVELTVERIDPAARELRLDTRDLDIHSVQLLDASGQARNLPFHFDARDAILGSRLTIDLAPQDGEPALQRLRIEYRTSSEASALQWLEPAQTSGPHPFMYSQGQAIHTRSWIPIQDSPAVRVRYTARIRTPPGLVAVMSAARITDAGAAPGEYRFEMRQPIPSYLIALAIGDLKFLSLGAHVGV